MKSLFFGLTICAAFFGGCESKDAQVTREECKKMGKTYREEEILNFRSGEYEIKKSCE